MGLYLCVFDDDDELEGVEIGSYADFDFFRKQVAEHLERAVWGSRFPTLMLHSDCDGEWSPAEAARLKDELQAISIAFRAMQAVPFHADWQREVADLQGIQPRNLFESLIDVDGEPLLDRLIRLCEVAVESGQPILFQ